MLLHVCRSAGVAAIFVGFAVVVRNDGCVPAKSGVDVGRNVMWRRSGDCLGIYVGRKNVRE